VLLHFGVHQVKKIKTNGPIIKHICIGV